MSPLHCWITLLAVTGGILFVPTQGRRLRHASWLSGGERCTRCPPGWGVERRCGAGRDTACTPCRPGERFAAHHSARSACLMCSRCGPGLFAVRACTPTHDTKCAACYPPPAAAHRNADYHRQCAGLVPVQQGGDDDDDDDEPMMSDAPGLATYGLSPVPARSKTDMARSILADPGQVQGPAPHALLGEHSEQQQQQQQYSLLAAPGQALAGPAYSVLTDDGPVSPAPPRRRPPRPRHPVRLSSPVSWGRPSAPSVNTQQRIKVSAPTTELPQLPLGLHPRNEEGDISAEEVDRLML